MRGRCYSWGIVNIEDPVIFIDKYCSSYNFDKTILFFIDTLFTIIEYLECTYEQEHCDFSLLRELLICRHLEDLKDVTNNVHYERWRRETLTKAGIKDKVL